MTTANNKLYEITKTDIKKAGEVLVTAFEYDPVWEQILKGCSFAKRCAWFESPIRYCMKYGHVMATSTDIEGVIGWLPCIYSEMTYKRMLKSGASRSGHKAGFSPMFRMLPLRVFGEHRNKHMKGLSYIYVMIVGVSPEHQGQGFGGKLLKQLINESQQSNLPIYLETSTKNNKDMYNHLGFKTLDEVHLPKFDFPQWELVREPNSM